MYKNVFGFLAILTALFINRAVAQDIDQPKVIPPSPTVGALMHFEELPVSHYTGQPDISLPLYSKSIYGDLKLDLTLKYTTMGVRINERSGWTGTGWALETGGVISRTVRGLPDEINNAGMLGVLHNTNYWNYNNLTSAEQEEFKWNVMGTSYKKYDSEHDLYQFNIPGASGRFVVVLENGVLVAKVISQEAAIKININYTSNLEIYRFTITDPYGTVYSFDEVEVTTATSYSASAPAGGGETSLSGYSPGSVYTSNMAWHLKTIAKNGSSGVSFTYDDVSESYTSSLSLTENHVLTIDGSTTGSSGFSTYFRNEYNKGIIKPRKVISYYAVAAQSKKPSQIQFADGTSVVLDYSTGHPETEGAILNSIIFNDAQGSVYKTYSFSYETVNERLWLVGVTEIADGSNYDYIINYNEKQNLPSFGSESDYWGYNKLSSPTPPVVDAPIPYDPDNITIGLISSIKYPTGGVKKFVFEQNTFSHGAGGSLTKEDLLKNPENYTIQQKDIYLNDTYNLVATNGEIYSDVISLTHDQLLYIDINNLRMRNTSTGVYEDVSNMFLDVGNSRLQMSQSAYVTMQAYEGNLQFLKLTTLNADTYEITGHIRIYYFDKHNTLLQFLYGGGLRIKEIAFYDRDGLVIPERKFTYYYMDPADPSKSAGAVDGVLGNLSQDYTRDVKRYLFNTEENSYGGFDARWIKYRIVSQQANAGLTNGSYVGYRTVKKVESGNGFVQYAYTSPVDYPTTIESFSFPFRPAENVDFKRGLLKSEKVYNEQGVLLKYDTMEYNFLEYSLAPSLKVVDLETCEWSVFYETYNEFINTTPVAARVPSCDAQGGLCITSFNNCGGSTIHLTHFADPLTGGRAQLVKRTAIEYLTDGPTTTTEEFSYNSQNFQLKESIKQWNENGNQYTSKKEIYYPVGDYPDGFSNPLKSRLAELNKINVPLIIREYRDAELVSTVQNVYNEFHTGVVELSVIKNSKGNDPLEPRITFHKYDTRGNLLEVSETDGFHTAYLWGYGSTVPVAKVENTSHSEISTIVNQFILSHPPDETTLEAELDKLRNTTSLSDAFITTFSYKPQFGISSFIDPNGLKTSYQYGDRGRLKYLLDHEGNVVQEFKYHYALEY